jgi:23S rRNA pseudouridine1911/1915/1917 synthase
MPIYGTSPGRSTVIGVESAMEQPSCFFHTSWPLLYEDNHLLVLYKPAGLLMQGDRTGDISLLDLGKLWLKKRYLKTGQVFLGLVHRLDRPVAGCVVFARTSKAAARLSEQFRSSRVKKIYLAVTEGSFRQNSGILQHYLKRDTHSSRIVTSSTSGALSARLAYKVLDTAADRTLVQLHLETGRKHQIRLQLAHIGNPIVGDLRYGSSVSFPCNQIALLAHELSIDHPTRQDRLTFRSPIPEGWPWPLTADPAGTCPWCWDLIKLTIDIHELGSL